VTRQSLAPKSDMAKRQSTADRPTQPSERGPRGKTGKTGAQGPRGLRGRAGKSATINQRELLHPTDVAIEAIYAELESLTRRVERIERRLEKS
jgi:hypothetical protein